MTFYQIFWGCSSDIRFPPHSLGGFIMISFMTDLVECESLSSKSSMNEEGP